VGNPNSVSDLFSAIGTAFGRLDVLFNNAGISAPGVPLEEVNYDQ
jgi:NAD(P)-dependent dehydrogenase (short-subunit alcohol dehydrogenase family)